MEFAGMLCLDWAHGVLNNAFVAVNLLVYSFWCMFFCFNFVPKVDFKGSAYERKKKCVWMASGAVVDDATDGWGFRAFCPYAGGDAVC